MVEERQMKIVGVVLLLVGVVGFLLALTGMDELIRPAMNLDLPLPAWGGMAAVGFGIVMMTRRPRD
jgi:hypothetical protein